MNSETKTAPKDVARNEVQSLKGRGIKPVLLNNGHALMDTTKNESLMIADISKDFHIKQHGRLYCRN
ncbi:MAG: hypothetical protein HQK62_11270 [Desulfamplus sp.]|nr:hypothetical protein [Desulfamplus sp.]